MRLGGAWDNGRKAKLFREVEYQGQIFAMRLIEIEIYCPYQAHDEQRTMLVALQRTLEGITVASRKKSASWWLLLSRRVRWEVCTGMFLKISVVLIYGDVDLVLLKPVHVQEYFHLVL